MRTAPDALFRTLADPTRRAIFERLARDGEQTVRVLTGHAGVSQPAVSKHLGVLKLAGLVSDRRQGRETHYSAQPDALRPLVDWMALYADFWRERFDALETLLNRMDQMTKTDVLPRSLVVEREMPHPPEKIWRVLTQASLIEEWLMKNDFQPKVGHKFNFRSEAMAHWNGVTDCEVLAVDPLKRLCYSWNASGEEAANGLKTVVTWTLTPSGGGTHVRMEQSGFRPQDERNYQGAVYGWQRFVSGLEKVAARLD